VNRTVPVPWPVYTSDAERRVVELIRRGLTYDYAGAGPVVELEQAFSELHEGLHTVSFNSGTSALFALYAALGIREGDEVIVPNLTFLATVSPLLWLGATPVLCDSAEDEPGVTAASIRRSLSPRTKAISVTHLFGLPLKMTEIASLAERENLLLVEDCSHAHASTIDGKSVGMHGDGAVYSIGSSKMVSGGHGGIMVTRHARVRDAALLIGHFKPRTRTDLLDPELRPHAEFALGGNLRLSPLAAALALDHVRCLDRLRTAKLANVSVLDEAVAGRLWPFAASGERVNGTHFDIVYALPPDQGAAERDRLIERLVAAGVPARAPATRPLNRVLRSIAHRPVNRQGALWDRLAAAAAGAPDDDHVTNSTRLHDRMVSFPSPLLYSQDATYAHVLAEAARSVLVTS